MSAERSRPGGEAIPRGRHAPPLEIRLERQRARLFEAAASVFARSGYADATAEAIAREAGMSKATFYEHFANKEECILELFRTAGTVLLAAIGTAREHADPDAGARERLHAGVTAFLEVIATYPDQAQTLLVEIIGAGPRAAALRDEMIGRFAQMLDEENALDAAAGRFPRFASEHDAYALIGAIAELVSRQLRRGTPADLRDLAPVVERLIMGALYLPQELTS